VHIGGCMANVADFCGFQVPGLAVMHVNAIECLNTLHASSGYAHYGIAVRANEAMEDRVDILLEKTTNASGIIL